MTSLETAETCFECQIVVAVAILVQEAMALKTQVSFVVSLDVKVTARHRAPFILRSFSVNSCKNVRLDRQFV